MPSIRAKVGNREPASEPVKPGEAFFSYLTGKQNEMLREYIANGRKAVPAYRKAYKNNMSDPAAEVAAYKILATNSMRLALSEIEKVAAHECAIDLVSHLKDLKSLRDKAEIARQFSAAISAEVARGKAAGLYIQRVEVTGKDGAAIGVSDIPLDKFKDARKKILEDC